MADGFTPVDLADASDADIVCVLVPDDVIPSLPLRRKADGLTDRRERLHVRLRPVRARRRHRDDRTAHARTRGATLLRGGHRLHHRGRRASRRHRARAGAALSRWPRRSAGCARARSSSRRARRRSSTSAVEQALSPALTQVNNTFVQVMLEQGIPLEAIITELVLSGEVERTMRLVREERLRGAVRVPLADEPVRPAHPRAAPTTSPRSGRPCGGSSTTSRRAASPTSGTPSATPAIPSSCELREQYAGPAVREYEEALRRSGLARRMRAT